MGTNFPGELEVLLFIPTNKLPVLCAGKMSSFSAQRMVNLHLNDYSFLEGIFHAGTNKFFSRVSGLTCRTCVLAASSHPQRDGRGALPALPACLLPPCRDGTGKGPKKHEEKTNHPAAPRAISRAGGSWRDGQSWAHKIFGIPAQLPGSRHGEGGGELWLPREGAENRSGDELPELFRGRQPRAICCVSVRGERAAALMIIIACFIFLLLFFLKGHSLGAAALTGERSDACSTGAGYGGLGEAPGCAEEPTELGVRKRCFGGAPRGLNKT